MSSNLAAADDDDGIAGSAAGAGGNMVADKNTCRKTLPFITLTKLDKIENCIKSITSDARRGRRDGCGIVGVGPDGSRRAAPDGDDAPEPPP